MRHHILLFTFLLFGSCQFFSDKKESVSKEDSLDDSTDTFTTSDRDTVLSKENDSNAIFFTSFEEMPEFPGGEGALRDFIISHTVYPESAIRDRVEGRVYVRFAIEKDGSVSVLGIARGIRHDLDDAALELARKMPPWKPGRQRGELIRITYHIPVNYSLEDLDAGKIRAEQSRTVKIYPNPTSGSINIEISELMPDLLFMVYDANGTMVKHGTITSRMETVDLFGHSNGIYIVRLSSEEENFVFSDRVIKR